MCEMQNAVKPKTKPSAKTGATFKVLATARSYFLLKKTSVLVGSTFEKA